MLTLRTRPVDPETAGTGGEVFACAYTPGGDAVLSASWDGALRLWQAGQEGQPAELRAGARPLSACAVTPDGKRWLSGSMDGMLGQWDAAGRHLLSMYLAHTRPVSAIVFSPDGGTLATASWDGQVILWQPGQERGSRPLHGHQDIVAGCCFTPRGHRLLSWGHDHTVRLWDVDRAQPLAVWKGHTDRVTAGAVSPDGRWFASGSRDHLLKLWDVKAGTETASASVGAEVCACLFLLDGESVVAVDTRGRLAVYTLPALEKRDDLYAGAPVFCAQGAPSGTQLALGCADGLVRFVGIDGLDAAALTVTAARAHRPPKSLFHRLLGRRQPTSFYVCTCPACGRSVEFPSPVGDVPAPCPGCSRRLRVCAVG
jgi:WD40 repeat protein